ncbi:MAG: GDYXXLXY domain-containing protein [Leptospirales bacterium]|nr:GDYXXLXY domain-containing protein [Leptospirales bacterium]
MDKLWNRLRFPGFVALIILQLAALGQMVFARQHLLDSGLPALLAVQPLDPRSLLSGYYVRLDLAASRIEASVPRLPATDTAQWKQGETVFVQLSKEEGRTVRHVSAISRDRRLLTTPGAIVLRGRVVESWEQRLVLNYGIEEYFTPQSEAARIEEAVAAASIEQGRNAEPPAAYVEIAVDPESGEGALRRLFIKGQPVQFH